MSRQTSTDLFELVRSLTPHEKRGFRIKAEKDGSPLYLKLYTAIEKQEVYNEAHVLKTAKEIKPSQLSNLKAYLYDLLLEHLNSRYNGKDLRAIIYSELVRADVLYDKGLYEQCSELLKKLKQTCREKENFLVLLSVIEREINLVKKNNLQWHLLEEKYNEKKEIVELVSRMDAYKYVRDLLGTFISGTGTVRSDDDRAKLQSLRRLLPRESEIMAESEKKVYYNVMYRYHFAMREYNDSYRNIKNLVQLHEHAPGKSMFNYLLYLANLSEVCIRLEKFDEGEQVLEKIRATQATAPREEVRKADYYYDYLMSLCNAKGDFKRAVSLLQEFRPRPLTDPITTLSVAFHGATAWFCFGDNHQALRQINTVINYPKTLAVWYYQCLARVLNLLIHYELGNDSLLAYNLRSTYRYLMQKGFLDPFEEVILEFIKAFFRKMEPGNENKLLRQMHDRLAEVLAQDTSDRFSHSHRNIVLALRSRLEKKPVNTF